MPRAWSAGCAPLSGSARRTTTLWLTSPLVYTIYGSGDVPHRRDIVHPAGDLPHLPRLGLQLRLPPAFERIDLVWARAAGELHRPQAGRRRGPLRRHGRRSSRPVCHPAGERQQDRRALGRPYRPAGVGLLAVRAAPTLKVSAHHYTTANLDKSTAYERTEWQPEMTLNLDYRQLGLGGASCGPATRPEYWLPIEPTRFQVRLRALDGSEPPEDLARQALP